MAYDRTFNAGDESQMVSVLVRDATSATAAGKTGITSGLTCWYVKDGANASVEVTLDYGGSVGTYLAGGFEEIDETNAPGLYQFGIPNAAISAAGGVTIYFKGAAIFTKSIRLLVEPPVGAAKSVAGAVGSVTGNVGGNVAGSVGSVTTKTGYELTAAYDAAKTAASAASVAALARAMAGYYGTVYTPADTAALLTACGSAVRGDVILLAAATYALSSVQTLNRASGVPIIGLGRKVSIITGSAAHTTYGALVPSTECVSRGFTVIATGDGVPIGARWGAAAPNVKGGSLEYEDVEAIGVADAFYLSQNGVFDHSYYVRLRGCRLVSAIDALVSSMDRGATDYQVVDVDNTEIVVRGDSSNGYNSVRGATIVNADTRIGSGVNIDVETSQDACEVKGIELIGGTARIARGAAIRTASTGASGIINDMVADSTSQLVVEDSAFDEAKVDNDGDLTVVRSIIPKSTALETTAQLAKTAAESTQTLAAGASGFAAIKGETAAILEDTGTTIPGTITAAKAVVDAILEDTGTALPASLPETGRAATTSTGAAIPITDGKVDANASVSLGEEDIDSIVAGLLAGGAATEATSEKILKVVQSK